MNILANKKNALVDCNFCKEHDMISNDDDHAWTKKLQDGWWYAGLDGE